MLHSPSVNRTSEPASRKLGAGSVFSGGPKPFSFLYKLLISNTNTIRYNLSIKKTEGFIEILLDTA
jgi:hypothetical protein